MNDVIHSTFFSHSNDVKHIHMCSCSTPSIVCRHYFILDQMIIPIATRILRQSAYTALRCSLGGSRKLSGTRFLAAKDLTMSSGPPKHEMQYFPQMVNALPSESAEFRRVLWTGLYSQVVLMTVPVGGDIGDEVSLLQTAGCLSD